MLCCDRSSRFHFTGSSSRRNKRLAKSHHRNPQPRYVCYFGQHTGNVRIPFPWPLAVFGMKFFILTRFSRMGDLVAFKEYENASAPFDWQEYDYVWKGDRRYFDFQPGSAKNASCQYPPFWDETGYLEGPNVTDNFDGCRASEFDQVRTDPPFSYT